MVIDLASVSNTQQINILCNGVLCKQTKAMKYLGIRIDDKLKWDSHMSIALLKKYRSIMLVCEE